MLCRNEIAAKEAERAMIAMATESYLAQGGAIRIGEPCKMTEAGLVHQHTFVINAPDKPKKEPKVRAPRERKPVSERQSMQELSKKAGAGRADWARAERAKKAPALAIHAGLGDSMEEAAKAMGICRNTARKIANEHGIKFKRNTIPGQSAE